jgi:hypothetical protein
MNVLVVGLFVCYPVHVAPACVGFGEGSDHFESYIRSLSLHLCKMLFPGLEPTTSWAQGNNFTAVPGLFFVCYHMVELVF